MGSGTIRSLPFQGAALSKGMALLVFGAALGVAWYFLAQLLPVGADYYWWYYRVPQQWLEGQTRLYDETSRQFFSPPWALWLLLPFASLESHWAMAAFTLGSMAIVAATSYAYAQENGADRPWKIALLATLCPYSLVMFFTGTPDAWSLLGIFLAYRAARLQHPWIYGVALPLATVRPQNVVLTMPALLLAVRRWPRGALARMALLPAAVFLHSLIVFGWDWPLRWWESYRLLPPSPRWFTSIYTGLELVGLPGGLLAPLALALAAVVLLHVGYTGPTRRGFEAAVTANAIAVPYIRSVSFVVLLALPWAGLAARRPRLAAAVYAVSLPTVAVSLFWERLAVVDVTFPILLLGLLFFEARSPIALKQDAS